MKKRLRHNSNTEVAERQEGDESPIRARIRRLFVDWQAEGKRLGEKDRTQAAFARMLGTTQQTVEGWFREEGRLTVPSGESLRSAGRDLPSLRALAAHGGKAPEKPPGRPSLAPNRQARSEVAAELRQQLGVVVRAVLGPTSVEAAAAARRVVDLAADANRQLERGQPGAEQG